MVVLRATLRFPLIVLVSAVFGPAAWPQAAQVGIDPEQAPQERMRIEAVSYRPATWERERVIEVETEPENQGGLVHVYFTNISSERVSTAFWRLNGKDESYWRLGFLLAWDRLYHRDLAPGDTTVLELNGVSEDFAEGKNFNFSLINRHDWRPMGRVSTRLAEDPVQISLVRFSHGLREAEVHIRIGQRKPVTFLSAEILGSETESIDWRGAEVATTGCAIARLTLKEPLAPSSLAIVRIDLREEGQEISVYAHRRAFEDSFPIGTWGVREGREEIYKAHHIDTCVQGGLATDKFFTETAPKHGFKSIVPIEKEPNIDSLRSLSGNPAALCWLLADEPDWHTPATNMLVADQIARRYDSTRPTHINLCRNVKFFEYAPISDIPGHDHYCVTAPSSSKWPTPYGTRLEETAYYTRDLKTASEPKPIWVWSQGVHEWDQRPKMPLPTAEELTAQLWLNVGRGAKGILWFTFDIEMGEKYPATRIAVRECGRVLRLIRDDLLGAEPYEADVAAPGKVDTATLVSWNRVYVVLTNTDYRIDDEAYQWTSVPSFTTEFDIPPWIEPKSALEITPEGPTPAEIEVIEKRVRIHAGALGVCRLFVISGEENLLERFNEDLNRILLDEG